MTDFVGNVLRPNASDRIIRSLMDTDFYKFTMGNFIYRYYRGVDVTFSFINRHTHIPVADIVDEDELRTELDHARSLRFRRTDLSYLRGMDVYGEAMLSGDFLEFLGGLQLPPYTLERVGRQYRFESKGPWELVTWWEIVFLAVLSELLYRKLLRSMAETGKAGETELRILYARAMDKIYRKFKRLKERGTVRFADFGLRRRHSFLWQKFVVEMAKEVMGSQFTGTSNAWLAFNQDLVPIGTSAHELPMVLTALADIDEEKREAQYDVLRKWQECYASPKMRALLITLPDTYGSAQFYEGMPKDLAERVAHEWRGERGDSGIVADETNRYLRWLSKYRVDPKTKLYIPSDGLDVEPMLEYDTEFNGRISISNGWGTKESNDFDGCHPRGNEFAVVNGKPLDITWDQALTGHSFVCKVSAANGRPAVKLSNNINKATGPKGEVERYLRIFGHSGRVAQQVIV